MDEPRPPQHTGQLVQRANWVLLGITGAFTGLAVLLFANLWGHPWRGPDIPLVDPSFLDPSASRQSYSDLVRAKEDLSDFSCYVCHERGQPPQLKFDEQHRVVVPEEHENIVMSHGDHNRNNHCFNCHNETNRETFHIRDGRDLSFAESSLLCGSCHGPTYQDWEGGAHGRTSGFWDRTKGAAHRLDCVNCHDPHAPRIPTRVPAPGPHALRPPTVPAAHPATTP